MSRLRVAGLILGALGVVLVGIGVVLLVQGADDSPAAPAGLASSLRSSTAAHAPFSGLRSTRVAVGGKPLQVVLAQTEAERSMGLRQRRDLGTYQGMLFVFPGSTSVAFTMSTVPVPLDIAFYDDRGVVVSRLRMEPCSGSESQCPLYESSGPFRYALETLSGRLPAGSLG